MGFTKPTTRDRKNPHPWLRVWVLTGTGAGCPEKPQGSLLQSLMTTSSVTHHTGTMGMTSLTTTTIRTTNNNDGKPPLGDFFFLWNIFFYQYWWNDDLNHNHNYQWQWRRTQHHTPYCHTMSPLPAIWNKNAQDMSMTLTCLLNIPSVAVFMRSLLSPP